MIVIPQKAEGKFAEVELLTSRDFGLTWTEIAVSEHSRMQKHARCAQEI
jgi:hypothetical protein